MLNLIPIQKLKKCSSIKHRHKKMNKNNDTMDLFENRCWDKLTNTYTPTETANFLSFKNALHVAYQLLYNDQWDEDLQSYSVKLLYEIRKKYPKEWNDNWEYEALLGQACYITRKYDERYKAYKQAFDKTNNPPPGLLIEFARCCICSGHPPISYDDAINLVKQALKDAPYSNGIGLLSHIYSLKEDEVNEEIWKKNLANCNKDFLAPSIEPKFLVEEYLQNKKL